MSDVQELNSLCARCLTLKIKAVHIGEEHYPALLKEIHDPPAVLFYRGSLDKITRRKTIAVIGSRRCSMYGRQVARKLSAGLCSAGACVVSGLARGIDGEAHRGALDGGGPTAAVFGGGPDVVYPPEHKKLAERITASGCIISEYPPGQPPARYTFPERNRIISGLSSAVVVVEAGEKSGTMITVGTALDQGREVYAVPGNIGKSTSTGTNRLLRDGAGIVLSPTELIEEIGLTPRAEPKENDPFLNLLRKKSLTVQELTTLLKRSPEEVTTKLLELELKGSVLRRPGNCFTAV